MKSRRRPLRKTKRSFAADCIATEIHDAIRRDLEPLTMCNEVQALTLAVSNQIRDFKKKYCSTTYDKDALEVLAFEKFLNVNERIREVNLNLRFPSSTRVQSSCTDMEKIHLRARALVHFVLDGFSIEEWFQECKTSSGSSIGVPYRDTSLERKFSYPISCTSSVLPLIRSYLDFDLSLKSAIDELNSHELSAPKEHLVKGSRATTVEKTDKARRLICVEPTWNMFFQQGLMLMMYKRLAAVGLDVQSLPDEHVRRAFRSSITSSEATIDWSSASDSVSMKLVEWILPQDWLFAVKHTRSPSTTVNGKEVPLEMFATMGNAVTFPLETLVFWAYGHAVRLTKEPGNTLFPEWEDLKCISVFGDDCIVPTYLAKDFIEVLGKIGFEVNEDKTFTDDGGFRESCGGDFFHGRDVRPYYLRSPRSTYVSSLEPWLYTIWNSLIKKYISYFGELKYVYDKELFRVMAKLFNQYRLLAKVVPDWFPDDAGLKVSSDLFRVRSCYPSIKFDRIVRDTHGCIHFRFMRFTYNVKRPISDALRYAVWLKKPSAIQERSIRSLQNEDLGGRVRYDRRIGGYVVARSCSAHWTLAA